MTSVDEIISSLLVSYNTSVLKDLPTDLREALYEEAKTCLENPDIANNPERCNERKTLMLLINNHRLNKKPVTDFIKGPFSVTLHWNSDLKLMIYIFGEVHRTKTDCHLFPQEKSINGEIVPLKSMFIEDYLKELLLNTDSYIDFFVEERAHIGYDPVLRHHKGSERLNILRNSFMECISDIKSRNKNINCRLSRSHYFDIRQGGTTINVVTKLYVIMKKLLTPSKEIIKENIQDLIVRLTNIKNNPTFYEFINDISTISSEQEFLDVLRNYVLFHNSILMRKMVRSSIYQTILRFIVDEIKLLALPLKKPLQTNLKNLFILLKNYRVIYDSTGTPKKVTVSSEDADIIISYVKMFKHFLLHMEALIADAYLLSRVFKKFNINTDEPKKKRGFDEPQTPHNVIIYAGDLHSKRYRKFLENNMNCKRLEQNIYDHSMPVHSTNCINMEGIKQPLFSYIPTEGFVHYSEPYQPIKIVEYLRENDARQNVALGAARSARRKIKSSE
jgi:hypothetical protein